MAIAPETIEEVKRTANVYDVISEYITLERTGSNYRALCPFHSEKTPSFMVSPQKNIFKCFGCGISGDAIKFVMEYEGLNFSDAIVKLAQKYNIPVRYIKSSENIAYLQGLYQITQKITSFYKEQLKKSEEARKYLKQRNISSTTADFFDIGYSPENPQELLEFCKKENISLENLKEIGLITLLEDGKVLDKFRGRIIFPIKDHRGRVVAFGGRSISPEKEPKYLNSPETKIYSKSKVLYGYFEAKDYLREKKEVIIVEGYFDLISLHQIGIKNVVATLGTAFTLDHAKLLKKFVNKAILMFDSDKAGKKAAIRASQLLLSQEIEVYYADMSKKDPDELAREGRSAVEQVIASSKDFLFFLLEKIKEEKELKKKKTLIDLYLDIVSFIPEKHVKGLYLKELSKELNIPVELLEVKDREVEIQREENEFEKNLFFPEKLILKTLVFEKDNLLRIFDKFDKIEGSEYFLYLLELVLNNQLSEEELEEIKNFPVNVDINGAVEALNNLHKKWIQKQVEISALFNQIDNSVLSLFLEKTKGGSDNK